MTLVQVEGWDEQEELWHSTGLFDLDTADGEANAKIAFLEMQKAYFPVKYTRLYLCELKQTPRPA